MRRRRRFERAVVHIGVHKTGTTSIQHTLFSSRALLSGDYDVCFASLRSSRGAWLYSRFCDAPHELPGNVRAGHDTLERAREVNRRRGEELDALLAQAGESVLVLSEEDLSSLSLSGVRRFKRWLEGFADSASIVLFLREPLSWATSRTLQALRVKLTLEQVYAKPLSFKGLQGRLAPWLEEFGREAITVRDYDDAANHPFGVVGAFCEDSGIPLSFVRRVDTSLWLNSSLSALGAHLLSELNRVRPRYLESGVNPARTPDDSRAFERVGGRRFELPRRVAERVVEESREDVQWVAENLGLEYPLESPPASPAGDIGLDPDCLESLALLIADLWQEARSRSGGP